MRIPSVVAMLLVVFLAMVVGPAGPLLADEWDDEAASEETGLEPARDGWYLGANYVRAFEMWHPHDPGTVQDPNGLSVRVGFRFLENWALGFQYEWLDDFELDTPEFRASGNVLTFNGRFYWPLGRIQPYGLFGIGYLQSSREGSFKRVVDGATGNFAIRTGGGVDWLLTRNWVLATEAVYVLPTGNLNAIQYLSLGIGLQYRFEPFVY